MTEPYLLAATVLLAAVSVALIRVLFSSQRVERLLALQLFGTGGTAVILLLAQGMDLPGLRNIALILGLLAATVAVAFVRYEISRSMARNSHEPVARQEPLE